MAGMSKPSSNLFYDVPHQTFRRVSKHVIHLWRAIYGGRAKVKRRLDGSNVRIIWCSEYGDRFSVLATIILNVRACVTMVNNQKT